MRYEDILRHFGHEIVVSVYSGLHDEVVNAAIECETCQEVLIDRDRPESS